MQDLLFSMVLLAFLKMLFEEARVLSWGWRLASALIFGIVVVLAQLWGQHLSLPKLEKLFYTPDALRNLALFVMIDLLLSCYKAISFVQNEASSIAVSASIPKGTSKLSDLPIGKTTPLKRIREWLGKALCRLPSLLFIPALFYVRLRLFYLFPGVSFARVTILLVVLVLLFVLFAPQLVNLFLDVKHRSLLSQLSVLISLLAFLLVVGAGVLHPESRIAGSYSTSFDWQSLVALLVVLLSGALLGFLLTAFRSKRSRSKNLSNKEYNNL